MVVFVAAACSGSTVAPVTTAPDDAIAEPSPTEPSSAPTAVEVAAPAPLTSTVKDLEDFPPYPDLVGARYAGDIDTVIDAFATRHGVDPRARLELDGEVHVLFIGTTIEPEFGSEIGQATVNVVFHPVGGGWEPTGTSGSWGPGLKCVDVGGYGIGSVTVWHAVTGRSEWSIEGYVGGLGGEKVALDAPGGAILTDDPPIDFGNVRFRAVDDQGRPLACPDSWLRDRAQWSPWPVEGPGGLVPVPQSSEIGGFPDVDPVSRCVWLRHVLPRSDEEVRLLVLWPTGSDFSWQPFRIDLPAPAEIESSYDEVLEHDLVVFYEASIVSVADVVGDPRYERQSHCEADGVIVPAFDGTDLMAIDAGPGDR